MIVGSAQIQTQTQKEREGGGEHYRFNVYRLCWTCLLASLEFGRRIRRIYGRVAGDGWMDGHEIKEEGIELKEALEV